MTTTSRVLGVLGLALVGLPLAACGSSSTPASPAASSVASAAQAATATVSCSYPSSGEAASKTVDPPATSGVAASGSTTAVMTLDDKPVTLTLDRSAAPCTTNSFVSLARQGYFDQTSCHRLTNQGLWVLQCGDPSATGAGGPGYAFADELTSAKKLTSAGSGAVVYPRGTLAMANAGPGTNGSQFFLVYKDSPLPAAYTVFGTIDQAGLAVIDEIASKGLGANGMQPVAPAKISKVTLG